MACFCPPGIPCLPPTALLCLMADVLIPPPPPPRHGACLRRRWHACASRAAASSCCSMARAAGGLSTTCWTAGQVRLSLTGVDKQDVDTRRVHLGRRACPVSPPRSCWLPSHNQLLHQACIAGTPGPASVSTAPRMHAAVDVPTGIPPNKRQILVAPRLCLPSAPLCSAGEHFRKWGCWWNRDIERIVRQAGLEVESLSRWHFGTTTLCVARPPAAAGSDVAGAA